MLDHATLLEHLHYDPETGIWTRLISAGRAKAGDRADSLTKGSKYYKLRLLGKQHNSHRLAWFYMTGAWPAQQIDHRDTNRHNNAWHNLRQATQIQNQGNQKHRQDSTSGFKGVTWCKARRKWIASIGYNYKRFHLGAFDTAEDAHRAYKKAALEKFGEFARHA